MLIDPLRRMVQLGPREERGFYGVGVWESFRRDNWRLCCVPVLRWLRWGVEKMGALAPIALCVVVVRQGAGYFMREGTGEDRCASCGGS
jgi:hypothetical protein